MRKEYLIEYILISITVVSIVLILLYCLGMP